MNIDSNKVLEILRKAIAKHEVINENEEFSTSAVVIAELVQVRIQIDQIMLEEMQAIADYFEEERAEMQREAENLDDLIEA